MRFGIILTIPFPVKKYSEDLYLLANAMRDRGHDVHFIGPEAADFDDTFPFSTGDLDDFDKASFWRNFELDAALVFTWMTRGGIVEALRNAGARVISRGDSDGYLGVRVYPARTLMRLLRSTEGWISKLRAVWYWLKRLFYLYKQDDAEIIRSLKSATAVLLETESARRNFARFLAHYKLSELSSRIYVVPCVVSKDIIEAAICAKRHGKIVAIGRWYDDAQKDTRLLIRTLELYLKIDPAAEVVIIGRAPEGAFSALTAAYPRVKVAGVVPHSEIVDHLRDAQVCLVTSRWESFHIAAHEALCLGASVVGPEVIPVPDIAKSGPFGTISRSRSCEAVAQALQTEMALWGNGSRDPKFIGEFWRQRVRPEAVASQLEQIILERCN